MKIFLSYLIASGALLLLTGCREQLVQNISEQQANRLVTRLDDGKIDSQKKRQADGRWSVEVERADLADAMREMERMRLLRDTTSPSSESSSVISNREQQRFAFERTLSAEIEQTLLSLKGVLEARVHLNLPQVDPLFGKILPGAKGGGSVFLITESQISANTQDIARLVAGAAGIEGETVSVLIEVEAQKAADIDEEPIGSVEPNQNLLTSLGVRQLKDALFQNAPFIFGGSLILIGLALVRKALAYTRPRIVS